MNSRTPNETGVGQSAHDTPNVPTLFYSRRIGPWLLTSTEPTAAHAKQIRSAPHDRP